MRLSGLIRKNRMLIIFMLVFAVIAAGMAVEFSRRMDASVAISAAEHDPEDTVFSGGIAGFPETRCYEWGIFVIGLTVAGVMAFLTLRSGWRKEKLFLAIAIPLGLIYLFMMVPLSIPDEQAHYQTAYQMSSIFLFKPGIGTAEHFDYSGLVGHYNLSSGYARMMREMFSSSSPGTEVSLPFHYDLTYPVMYLPQALGLALGRLLGGNFVQIFLLGRLFNLLFYSLCVYWAIRMTPGHKMLFIMVGLTPMAIHQAASLSYDAFNIGGSLLLFGAVFKAASWKGKATIREFLVIVLIGLMLIPAKPTNFPLLLTWLLIPSKRFQSKRQKWIWLIGVWLLTLVAVLLIQMNGISGVATSYNMAVNWEGKQNYSIAYALAHPMETVKVYLNTIRINGSWLFYQSIGNVLGGQTIPLPMKYIKIYLLLLIFCVLRRESGNNCVIWKDRAILLGSAALSVFLTMTTMFLIWTSEGIETIQGLQGRYFTPFLLPALLCLNNDIIVLRGDVDCFVVITGLVIHAGIIMEVLCRTMLI